MKKDKTFKKLRSLIVIRSLFFLLFKISLSIISIVFISIIAFIIILSTKPRVVPIVNNYIIEMANKVDNVNINFDKSNATLYFNENLGLQYEISDVVLKLYNGTFKFSRLVLNLDFSKLLFGKININSIVLTNSTFKIDLTKQNKDEEKYDYKDILENLQKIISKFSSNSFLISKFTLRDFKISLFIDNKESDIYIKNSELNIDVQKNNLIINQDIVFNVNRNKLNSRMKVACKNQKNGKICNIDFYNINPNNYVDFFNENNKSHDYLKNIKGYFNASINFNLDKNLKFADGKFTLTCPIGSFYLKQFFDERITFTKMVVDGSFVDNFKKFNLDSVTTNFDKTEFMMSLGFKEYEDYKNLDLYFDIKKIPLLNLKQLWPNFLGQEEGIRPWVIEHITGGTSPHATAKMNIKYFNVEDKDHDSGLQDIYSEVQMEKVLLNYNEYFPEVSNIDGLAIFKKTDMLINIDSGNVLKSKINKGSVAINFVPDNKVVVIKANTKGPFSDLFVHIDKSEKKIIENNVNSIIEDYYTNSNLHLDIPIEDNINFNMAGILVDSVLVNKKNSTLKNSASIPLSFIKPRNSDSFFGNINLTRSDIEYLPLNIYKPSKRELMFNYKATLKDNVVYINEFIPLIDYISFDLKGFIDIENKKQEVSIENIEYNKSKYNIYYKSYVIQDKLYNYVDIDGENINYDNILTRMKNSNTNDSSNQNVNNQTIVNLNLEYLSFSDGKKLLNPVVSSRIENNVNVFLNFSADMGHKKYMKLNLNKKNMMFKLESNDFGTLFSTIDLTNSIEGGEGEISLNQKIIDGKNVIVGDLKLNKKFSILPNEQIKMDLLSDVEKDKNFKELNKSLKKDTKITFNKLRGEFEYDNNILRFKEVVANSRFINLQILASGYINLKTDQMKIEGLLVPLGFINGLFGVNKLPVIGDLIFGQKDAGLFASRFSITKKNANDKINIDINKFSMILPGFLRNIFDKNNYINQN